ncbi:MAG TPA: CoA transferase [Dehalococcoidia bacterium]|nr:CoA transferase [Dehalococcoidia bacterium]
MNEKRLPLEGVRVLDFTWAWAGPQATLLLALMGAEVIKVESQRRLDHSRLRSLVAGPGMSGPDASFIFNTLNLNKLSVTLNLSKPEAIEIAKSLAKISDVVAQNMRPGVLERLGLGYEDLKAVKPDIVMLSSSAVGSSGPERLYTGYAPTFAAMGGMAYITGRAGGKPAPLMGTIDLRVGSTGTFAVLAALYHRKLTGEGQHIDLSSAEAVSALMGDAFMDYTMNGRVQDRVGNRDRAMAPHAVYRCRDDKWVSIAVGSEAEWRALRGVIGDLRLVEDSRFADAFSRWQNQEALDEIIGVWTAERTPIEVMDLLQPAGVAAMPVYGGEEIVEDRHVLSRGILEEVEHPLMGKKKVLGPPWRLSKTPARVIRHGPLLGEHNDYVLGELLGMSKEEMERLAADEVLY